MDTATAVPQELTGSLEMYLKTIAARSRADGEVRVRDLAHDLGVRAPSVTAAVKRLVQLGLVQHVQRESVRLTPAGIERARRIESRHSVLRWFFEEVLRLPESEAAENACEMEHVLTPGAMNRLVSLYEFVRGCPPGREAFLDRFHHCPVFEAGSSHCDSSCSLTVRTQSPARSKEKGVFMQLGRMKPGASGRVLRVEGTGELRQRLIELGLLPDQEVTVERTGPRGDPMWIRFAGFQLALRRTEANLVVLRVDAN